MTTSASSKYFNICDCIIKVESDSRYLLSTILSLYGEMLIPDSGGLKADLSYKIGNVSSESNLFYIARKNISNIITDNIADFVFVFEKDMTIELQKIRSDLYFIHSAVIEYRGSAFLISAPSGSGKSTTSWALLHADFQYLSDELAPVDLKNLSVLPYPHALCLKAVLSEYPLPDSALDTDRTLHIPTHALPAKSINIKLPIVAIFFIEYLPEAIQSICETTKATAASKIYSNSLNALAHSSKGLDAAITMARKIPCYDIKTADIEFTCQKIVTTLESLLSDLNK